MQKNLLKYVAMGVTSVLLSGCGGGGDSSSSLQDSTGTTTVGYLIDAPVANMGYECGTTKDKTGDDGKFECTALPVVFKVGSITIGSINKITEDSRVYPQDLVGVGREKVNNLEVLKIASFLQSLDDDGDISTVIKITSNVDFSNAKILKDMSQTAVETLLKDKGITPVALNDAKKHLEEHTPMANQDNNTTSSTETNSTGTNIDNHTTNTTDTNSTGTNIDNNTTNTTDTTNSTGTNIDNHTTNTIDTNSTDTTLSAKDEPYYKYSWHINSKDSALNAHGYSIDNDADIGVEEAWKTTMGKGVVIAVIDDGADLTHEDLKANIKVAYNSVNRNNLAQYVADEENPASHGNTCAGFMVAPINGKGIVGMAPESKIVIIQNPADATDADTIHAFEYAKSQGAKVISCSWGTENVSDALKAEFKSLYDANITLLFASGNDGKTLDTTGLNDESEVEWVIGVGASGENNDVTSYSNYGEYIDVIAPGGDTDTSSGILGLDDMGTKGNPENQFELVNNNYGFETGTSFATPVTAGVVALMYAVNPNITPLQVKNILIQTADKIGTDTGANYNTQGFDTKRAYGKINAQKAVAEAKKL